MKRVLLTVTVIVLAGGCLPFSPAPNPGPTVDIAASAAANVQTAVAQTLAAQPTETFVLPTETLEPTLPVEETLVPSETLPSETLPPTTIVETATVMPPAIDVTATTGVIMSPVGGLGGAASLTPTYSVLTYGTLPPAVPFSSVVLINRSKRQAYISLQVVTAQGGPTIIEYFVRGQIKIKAPIGSYLYVAWIGGRKMVGEFRLHHDQELSIVLYQDRVEIR